MFVITGGTCAMSVSKLSIGYTFYKLYKKTVISSGQIIFINDLDMIEYFILYFILKAKLCDLSSCNLQAA